MLWHLGPSLLSNWGTTLQHMDTVTSHSCMYLLLDIVLFLHLVPKMFKFQCRHLFSCPLSRQCSWIRSPNVCPECTKGAGEMAQCVRTPAAKLDSLSFLSRTQSQKQRTDCTNHPLTSTCVTQHRYAYTHTHKINNILSFIQKWMKQFTFSVL